MKEENKPNKLAQLSTAELEKERNKLKGVGIGLGLIMVFASGFLIYVLLQSEKRGLLGIIPSLFLTMFPVFIRIGQINKELKSRK